MIKKVLGLMSGTSMDGVDAAFMETDGVKVCNPICNSTISYPKEAKIIFKSIQLAHKLAKGSIPKARENYLSSLKQYLNEVINLKGDDLENKYEEVLSWFKDNSTFNEDLNYELAVRLSAKYHKDVVDKLLTDNNIDKSEVELIGYHGQTVFHNPAALITVQEGDGQWLATSLGIDVVADFRTNDVKNGGQGAPFAPLYHKALAEEQGLVPVVIANCGGISNITVITEEDSGLYAFDPGPGNALIDEFVKLKTKGEHTYDKDGQFGLKGKVNNEVLEFLFKSSVIKNGKNYFEIIPPKSLDANDFILIPEVIELSLEDGCRTLEAFTGESIVRELNHIEDRGIKIPTDWVVAGGGWNNPVILNEFKERLTAKYGSKVSVKTAAAVNWNSDALEAQIFSYLAVRTLKGLPLSVPGTTGVKEPLTGGVLFKA